MLDTRVMSVHDRSIGTIIGWHVNAPDVMDTFDIEWADGSMTEGGTSVLFVRLDDLDDDDGGIVDYWSWLARQREI